MVYVGSKNRIYKPLKVIIERYLKEEGIKTYIEPFMGGCNLLDKIDAETKIGSDYNKYLVALFNGIKEGRRVTKFYSKKEYYEFAERFKKGEIEDDFLIGWVGFIFSFNSKFMEGYGGKFNCKKMKKIAISYMKNIIKQTKTKLMDVDLYNRDYMFYKEYKDCLFYLDPPYEGTVKYGGGKKEFNHKKFWNFALELSKNNIVLISEYNAPEDFKIIWENPIELKSLATKEISKRQTEKLFKLK